VTLVSGTINFFVDIRKRFSDNCRQTGVGVVNIDEFAVFVSFGNNVDIVVHHDHNPFWISADTNKNDLECPIRLKVRVPDNTPDVGLQCGQ